MTGIAKQYNRAGTSVLFALPVRGVGTAEVESLTSYVCRLAEAHATLPALLIASLLSAGPRIAKPHLAVKLGESLCGNPKTTRAVVSALISRTWRGEVGRTVFDGRLNGLQLQGALRSHSAWCPPCVSEADFYGRLIWTLRAYGTCHVHNVRLVDVCSGCSLKHRPFDARASRNDCPRCGAPLGSAGTKAYPTVIDQRLHALVARIERCEPVGEAEVRGVVLAALRRHGSIRGLSKGVGIGKATIQAYRVGEHQPLLSMFLRLLENEPCLDTALSKPAPRHIVAGSGGAPGLRKSIDGLLAELTKLLAGADADIPPLRPLANAHGASRELVRRRAPALTGELIRRRAAHRAERRRLYELDLKTRVHEAVRRVHGRGHTFGRRDVEAELGQPGLLRAPYLNAAYREECDRLEAA